MDGEKLKGFLKEQRKKIADSELPLRNIRVLDVSSGCIDFALPKSP